MKVFFPNPAVLASRMGEPARGSVFVPAAFRQGMASMALPGRGGKVRFSATTEAISVDTCYFGKAQYVRGNRWAIAPRNIPLYTGQMRECRGLILENETHHLLAHLYPVTTVMELQELFRNARDRYNLDVTTAKVSVMRGCYYSPQLEENIEAAVRYQCPGKTDPVVFFEDGLNAPLAASVVITRKGIMNGLYTKAAPEAVDVHKVCPI